MNKRSQKDESQPVETENHSLAERLSEVEGVDEDIAQIIANNWRQVAVIVAVIILSAWAVNEFRSGSSKHTEQLSKQFVEAQELFEKVKQGGDKAKGEEAEKEMVAMREKFRTISENGNEGFYSQAAAIYQATDLLKADKVDEALAILGKFQIHRYESKQQVGVASGDSSEYMLDEFAALLYAKGLLAKATPEIETARNYLIGLAYQGHLLNCEAILTLARVSTDDQQRQETATVAHDVAIGRPELADTIESDIAPYGYSIGS